MRNFFAFIGLVVVGFCGVGYYLGWYKFALSPGQDGKQHISVDVDTKKVVSDTEKGAEQIGEKGGKLIKDNLKKENDTHSADFVGPPEPAPKSPVNTPAPR